jgi:hypothetical protein
MSLDINLTGVEKTSNKKTNLTDNSDTFYPSQKAVKTAVDLKVDAVAGKGLSENDFTNTLKTKLDGIQAGAEVNVNADWNATSGDAQILNKPTIPDTSDFVEKSDFTSHSILAKQSGASDPVAVSIGNNEILGRKSGGGSNIEGLSVSEVKSLLNYTASDVGAVATNSAITGATKTKISYDAKGLVTSGADATTADIADSSNKRYVTDAQLTVIGNTSGTNTGDETETSILSKLGWFSIQDQVLGTVSSGTSNTISKSIALPSVPSVLNFRAVFLKTGTIGSFTVRAYISEVDNNITGTAVLIATFSSTAANITYLPMKRTFNFVGTNIIGVNPTATLLTDDAQATSRLNTAFPTGTPLYLIFAVQCASASDSARIESVEISNF